ncbi:MAG: outer membrane protein assembly factor BamE [Paludibacteraceae bacterium]|nr:outer membrane protein assembly factor BamE [Paludibacteraceae bacterium]
MKKALLLFCIVIAMPSFAGVSLEKLSELSMGMTMVEVKQIMGEPIKYKKLGDNEWMLLYNLESPNDSIKEYHLYFKDKMLTSANESKGKEETLNLLTKSKPIVNPLEGCIIDGRNLVITKIIENVEMNYDQIVDAFFSGITRACNGSKGDFQMKESNHIVYKGKIDKVITFDGRWGSINVFYTLDLAIKPGRVRIKVIGDEIDWHQDNDQLTYYFADVVPFGSTVMKELKEKEALSFSYNTVDIFNHYLNVIEGELTKKINDEDW